MPENCLTKEEELAVCNNISNNDLNDWIPFVGPTWKSIVRKDTKSSMRITDELNKAKSNLDVMVSKWRNKITDTVYKNSKITNDMLTVIAGPPGTEFKSTDSYVGLVSALTVEPFAERQGYIIITVISIIISFFFIFSKIIEI